MSKPIDFDDYISRFPDEIAERLQAIRETIGNAAPEAGEFISYSMPLYKFKGRLIYFAAHTSHIGLYAMGSTIEAFKDELVGYKTSKGTIKLQNDEPLPLDLIGRIAKFRVIENLKKADRNKL